MRVLYYECQSGISGDMNLGALLDLGVEEAYLRAELSKLGLDDAFRLDVARAHKNGIYGTQVKVHLTQEHSYAKWHCHPHDVCHHHRTYRDIAMIIQNSTLSDAVKERSLTMFWLIALAEAKVHAKTSENVTFHEVGAIDSIVDIVGAAICLESLHVRKVIASTVELGGGFVTCAHGVIPVPAPATVEILQDVPVSLGRVAFETTTPTGAAILKANVDVFEERPTVRIQKMGYGIGHKTFEIPNVLRVYLCEEVEVLDEEIVLETNIDDMSPEILAYVQERLFAVGAKDVYTSAITTKKNRLGVKLSVLVSQDVEADAKRVIFEESTSIGLRRYVVQKIVLERFFERVETPFGEISVKCTYDKGKLLKYKAEFDACKRAALEHHVPILSVYDAVAKKMREYDGFKIS